MNLRLFACAAVAAVSFAAAGQAFAASGGIITDAGGNYAVGIAANGNLFGPGGGGCEECETDSPIGFVRLSDGFDPIQPGTPRDSWGIAVVGGGYAYADPTFFGDSGILGTSETYGASTASLLTMTELGLTVAQDYSFVSGGNILKIVTSITNDGLDDIGEVLFQRNVDWDIDPTAFDEQISGPHGPGYAGVIDSSWYGFEDPNPFAAYGNSCFFGCNTDPGDLGGGIKLSIGGLLSGATKRFVFYYGINESGQSVEDLIDEGLSAGARYIIAGRSNDNSTEGQNSAFIGVVAFNAVPEPATWAMMIMGFYGLGSMVRRRKAALA